MSDYLLRTEMAVREFGWKQHQTQIWFKRDRLPLGHRAWPKHCYEPILWFSKTPRPFCDPTACGKPSADLAVRAYNWSEWTEGQKPRKRGVAKIGDVFIVPVGANRKGTGHPAVFPVPLAEQLIETFCPPGGTVLDPFCGSGSTLVAAKNSGRAYYGFDIMGDYCKTASRLLNASGESPVMPKAG